jgi:membrane protease YdiL (CAAX protease family)
MASTDRKADTQAEERRASLDPIAKVPIWTLLPVVIVVGAVSQAVVGQALSPELENKALLLVVALAVIGWWRWTVADVTRRARFFARMPSVGNVLKPAAKVALAGILTTLLWVVIQHQLRLPRIGLVEAPTAVDTRTGGGTEALSVLAFVFAGPAAEELFFRGSLFRKWRLRWGGGKAALATSVLFGLLHSTPITTSLFGLALVMLYTTTRTIWAPVVAHMLNNLFPVVLTLAGPLLPYELLAAAATQPVQLAALVPALAGTFWLVRFIWRSRHTLADPVDGVTADSGATPSSISS